jgi:hypothetical protein
MSDRNFSTKIPHFTKSRKLLLEKTDLLSIGIKVELLEMYSHSRLLTEKSFRDGNADNKTIKATEKLISALGFHSFLSSKKSRFTNQLFDFLIISANQATDEYMKKFEYDINSYELGLLYGYHPKSILAFHYLIERQSKAKNDKSYRYFNSKVFSQNYFDEEDKYHEVIWEQLRNLSPKIISQAETYFEQKKTKPQKS